MLCDVIPLSHTHHVLYVCVYVCLCVLCGVCKPHVYVCSVLLFVYIFAAAHMCWSSEADQNRPLSLYFLFFFCLSLSPSLFITLCQQLPWKLFCSSSLHSWCVWLVSAPLLNETQTHVGAHKHTDVHTRGNCPWGGSVGAGSDVT